MMTALATIAPMAKKPKASGGKPGRPATGRKPAYILYARIDPAIGAALDDHVVNTKPKTTAAGVVELALEEYFKTRGIAIAPPPTEES